MINWNEYDLDKFYKWETILNKLGEESPSDQEVWEIAREYKEIPIFENILLELTANRLQQKLEEMYPDAEYDYYINAMDSYFYVNEDEVYSLEDIEEAIK
jgi:hypothetical protein